MSDINKDQQEPLEVNNAEEVSEERRNALAKLGKYAYAAPAVTGLLISKKASAVSGGPPAPPAP